MWFRSTELAAHASAPRLLRCVRNMLAARDDRDRVIFCQGISAKDTSANDSAPNTAQPSRQVRKWRK